MLLYIHIPYCDSKCFYCSFNSYVDKFDTRAKYMEALLIQFEREIERFNLKEDSISSLFIGGGTPSTVSPKLYRDIFKSIKPFLKENAEVTTEANPNSATKSWLEGMRELGVNRVSFGVQSFDDKKLKELGRSHSSKVAKESINIAREIGFENFSLDLIYSYKNDTKDLLKRDIDLALELGVSHISAYELTVEANTIFESSPEVATGSEELARFISEYIPSLGLSQYEVSNYGRPSIHNLGYWELKNYIGLGAGAVGFLESIRLYPNRDITSYIHNPNSVDVERLSEDEIKSEKIFLGLRSRMGVDIDILPDIQRAEILIDEGRVYREGERIYSLDYLLADEMALFLMG